MMLKNKQIAFIGGGHITEIIVGNLIRTQTVSPDQIIVSDPDKDRLQTLCEMHALGIATDNIDAVNRSDFVFINVLPQVVAEVIEELAQKPISEDKVIISIAGGVPIERYKPLGEKLPVVRALPNPPSQIGWRLQPLRLPPG